MADISNGTYWSSTDASNDAASPNGINSTTTPANVIPIVQNITGALRRVWEYCGPVVTSGGSANAQTYTSTNATYPVALTQGQIFTFIAGYTNSGATTFQINSLTATAIEKSGASGPTALTGNEIQAGSVVTLAYDGSVFQLISSYYYSAGSAAAFVPTGSAAPTNGLYLAATNAPGISANSNLVAKFLNSGTAVNYLTLTNAATMGNPAISAVGSDTNINLYFQTQGAGVATFITNSSIQTSIGGPTSAVNYLSFNGATTSNSPSVAVAGSDTNINLTLTPKGSGVLKMGTTGSFTANGATAASFGSTSPGHATPQKWLTIQDSSGSTFYIPVF